MLILTTEQMRQVEKLADESGLSYAQLMENAGTVAYQYLNLRYGISAKHCVILAGKGNNGGDGFVIARLLFEAGAEPVVLLCCGVPQTETAIRSYNRLLDMGVCVLDVSVERELAFGYIESAQIIIDAIFGTGFHGEVSATAADVLACANNAKGTRISLDIPSGMNADSGAAGEICFRADITLSFAAYKPAHQSAVSKPRCGSIEVLDIGIPGDIIFSVLNHVTEITEELVREILPVRNPQSHKGNYGRLLIVAGSRRMGGAAMMATLAALRMGAGITILATPCSVASMVSPHLMEAMTLPLDETSEGALSHTCRSELGRALSVSTACLAGCGLSVTAEVKSVVESLLEVSPCSLVLDADALNCISTNLAVLERSRKIPVLTPHIGEMARLVDMTPAQVEENAISVAKLFAREKNVVVVLKSHRTVIATPAGEVFENTTGNCGLAKGGSGDVLAGMIAALAAQGMSAKNAAVCGVYLHGLCADRLASTMSEYSMLARDVIAEIPAALKSIEH